MVEGVGGEEVHLCEIWGERDGQQVAYRQGESAEKRFVVSRVWKGMPFLNIASLVSSTLNTATYQMWQADLTRVPTGLGKHIRNS